MTGPKRGELYRIEVLQNETVGDEFYGHHWYVIVSSPEVLSLGNVVLAVPLTSPTSKFTGLEKDADPKYRRIRIRVLEKSKILEPGVSFEGESLALVHQVRPLAIRALYKPDRHRKAR